MLEVSPSLWRGQAKPRLPLKTGRMDPVGSLMWFRNLVRLKIPLFRFYVLLSVESFTRLKYGSTEAFS